MNLPFNFDKAIAGITKVKLPGGVVGRVTLSVSVVSLCMTAIAWSAKNETLSMGIAGGVFLLAFVMLWRLINFADRNPQAALLEGAEFLMHEQIVHASKSLPVIPRELNVHEAPDLLEAPEENPNVADVPESEPQSLGNGGRQ